MMADSIVEAVRGGWRAENYGLFSHNCQDFVDDVLHLYRLISMSDALGQIR